MPRDQRKALIRLGGLSKSASPIPGDSLLKLSVPYGAAQTEGLSYCAETEGLFYCAGADCAVLS